MLTISFTPPGSQNIYKAFVVGFPTANTRNCFNFDSDEGMFRLEPTEGNWVSLPLGFSGVKVNSLALAGERLYAATNQGVARLSGGDFEPWDRGLPTGADVTEVVYQGGRLYCLVKEYISRAELIRRIGGAACCVVPLRDAVVAAGQNSMFEAMSLGRPLVITENVATVEYATHGENALLCPERDPKALAAAVCSVLADPPRAAAMGDQARQAARAWLDRQIAVFLDAFLVTVAKTSGR